MWILTRCMRGPHCVSLLILPSYQRSPHLSHIILFLWQKKVLQRFFASIDLTIHSYPIHFNIVWSFISLLSAYTPFVHVCACTVTNLLLSCFFLSLITSLLDQMTFLLQSYGKQERVFQIDSKKKVAILHCHLK